MKIGKTKNNLIITLPLWQSNYDAIGERIEDAPNLVGIIAGEDYSLSQMIALGYKDDLQEGMPIVMFDDKDELIKVCKDFGISLWEYPLCAYCHKPLRSGFTIGKKGNMCFKCEEKHD